MKTDRAARPRAGPSVEGIEKVVGVLGGMGPEATATFLARLISRTEASKDAEHLRILVDCNPKIPDRTAAILGTGESPLPELVRSARALKRAGAHFIVIPCVTVHSFHEALQRRTPLPVLHIVRETAATVLARRPRPRRIGLLGTTGTLQSKLFQRAFDGTRTTILVPSAGTQAKVVMKAIYAVKATGPGDQPRAWARQAAEELIARKVDIIIAGCTELPLVLHDGDVAVPVVDPLTALADAAIRFAGGRVRKSVR